MLNYLVSVDEAGNVLLPANLKIPVANISGLIVNGKIDESWLPAVTVEDVEGLILGDTGQIDPALIPTISKDKIAWLFSGDTINPTYLPASSGGSGGPNFTQDVSIFEHSLGVGGAAGEWNITLYPVIGKKRGINLGNGIALDATVDGKVSIFGSLELGAVKVTNLSIAGLNGGLPLMYDAAQDKIIESGIKYTGTPQAIKIPHVYIPPTPEADADRRLMFTTPLAEFREQTVHILSFVDSSSQVGTLVPYHLLSSYLDTDPQHVSDRAVWRFYVYSNGQVRYWKLGQSEVVIGTVPTARWHWFSFAFVKKNFLNWEIWVYVDGDFLYKVAIDRPEVIATLGPISTTDRLAVARVVITETKLILSQNTPEFGSIINGVDAGAGSVVFSPSGVQNETTWLADSSEGWTLTSDVEVLQVKNN